MIKFRVWNKKTKSFIDDCDIVLDLISSKIYAGDIGLMDSVIDVTEQIILMQSTGLKDKNGVEIYVGDIVKGEQWLTTTMPAQIVDQVSYSERNTMFYLGGANESHDRFMHSLGNTIYQYEVVGNIYANPELLSNP